MPCTNIFGPNIFTRRKVVVASLFIRAMHPKTSIRPDREAIRRILASGWIGQAKINDHRAQIHVPAAGEPIIVYNRHGAKHAKVLPTVMENEIRRVYAPTVGWNVIDAEWIKSKSLLYVFDWLKFNDKLLNDYNYLERHELLPRIHGSPCLLTLPVLRTLEMCMALLARPDPDVEGLVFKAAKTPGFQDTSIIRCRKAPDA